MAVNERLDDQQDPVFAQRRVGELQYYAHFVYETFHLVQPWWICVCLLLKPLSTQCFNLGVCCQCVVFFFFTSRLKDRSYTDIRVCGFVKVAGTDTCRTGLSKSRRSKDQLTKVIQAECS